MTHPSTTLPLPSTAHTPQLPAKKRATITAQQQHNQYATIVCTYNTRAYARQALFYGDVVLCAGNFW